MKALIEKITVAVFPLLVSGILYLFSNVIALQTDVQVLKANAMTAKLQLKLDMTEEQMKSQERIAVLETEIKQLQNQLNSHK
jgi:hypothetical protein